MTGVPDGRGGTIKGTGIYKFGMNGDSDAIFMRVFGTGNPFAELFQVAAESITIRTTIMPAQCWLIYF